MPVRVNFASFVEAATPVTIFLSAILSSEQTSVPFLSSPRSLKLDRTLKTTSLFIAVSTERVCRTLAPREAISNISSYEILSSLLAVGTLFGSEV